MRARSNIPVPGAALKSAGKAKRSSASIEPAPVAANTASAAPKHQAVKPAAAGAVHKPEGAQQQQQQRPNKQPVQQLNKQPVKGAAETKKKK